MGFIHLVLFNVAALKNTMFSGDRLKRGRKKKLRSYTSENETSDCSFECYRWMDDREKEREREKAGVRWVGLSLSHVYFVMKTAAG